jgi:hypothetical protein
LEQSSRAALKEVDYGYVLKAEPSPCKKGDASERIVETYLSLSERKSKP